jgi:hypothetical protein
MTAANRVGLVVKMPRRQVWMQGNLVVAGQADVENLGLRMVDPDDRMEVGRHVLSFFGSDRRVDLQPDAGGIFEKGYPKGASAN